MGMQIVFGIAALAIGVALTWMGRVSNSGTGPVATVVQSENLALFYIIGCLTLIVAGVASLVTAF
jgi:hypothetical protein